MMCRCISLAYPGCLLSCIQSLIFPRDTQVESIQLQHDSTWQVESNIIPRGSGRCRD
jgi:hypothetical protein